MSYYLVERSGESRQVWGPYDSLDRAKREAGVRHAVVRGAGLTNGQTMTRGELHCKLAAGSVYPVNGSRADCIA
jgi:hypothetical protein